MNNTTSRLLPTVALLCISLSVHAYNPVESWHKSSLENKIIIGIAGITAVAYAGAKIYDAYTFYYSSNEQVIATCRQHYQKINNIINEHQKLYFPDTELDNDLLKEKIKNSSCTLPFKNYYDSVCNAISKIEQHIVAVEYELKKIAYRTQHTSDNTMITFFSKLEVKCSRSLLDARETVAQLRVLKQRITEFPDYQIDHQQWLYLESLNQQDSYESDYDTSSDTCSTSSLDSSSSTSSSCEQSHDNFGEILETINEFNLNYY